MGAGGDAAVSSGSGVLESGRAAVRSAGGVPFTGALLLESGLPTVGTEASVFESLTNLNQSNSPICRGHISAVRLCCTLDSAMDGWMDGSRSMRIDELLVSFFYHGNFLMIIVIIALN